ncbi:MAG: hypothetical protein EAZ20_03035 [Bacteroidetes bacterium]|nr:MAG: hypothetical protein EAZ20_03035 [Bacteroidota bacterium]
MITPQQQRSTGSKTSQKRTSKKTADAEKNESSQSFSSEKETKTTQKSQPQTKPNYTTTNKKRSSLDSSFAEVFTSSALKGLVLLLIVAFNVIVLKNSFLLAVPAGAFSGDAQLDALLYGMAISVLMVIVLFHEEKWQNPFCAGAVTLYLDALILVLYMRWFEFLIGGWGTIWLMSGIMTLLPVVGLFIMVLMLKPKENVYA